MTHNLALYSFAAGGPEMDKSADARMVCARVMSPPAVLFNVHNMQINAMNRAGLSFLAAASGGTIVETTRYY
jgi:hypothetical protein